MFGKFGVGLDMLRQQVATGIGQANFISLLVGRRHLMPQRLIGHWVGAGGGIIRAFPAFALPVTHADRRPEVGRTGFNR